MYLTRFGVKNYKCLGEIDIPLTPIHVLIGENDSGKSSLLEAIEIFNGSANDQLSNVLPNIWEINELICYRSQQPYIAFEGEFLVPPHDKYKDEKICYGFSVEGKNDSFIISNEWIRSSPLNKFSLKSHESFNRTALYTLKQQVVSEVITLGSIEHRIRDSDEMKSIVHTISNIINPAHSYSFKSKELASPTSININRKFRMDRNGYGLATLLDDLLGYDAKEYVRLCEEFCLLFPQFRNIRIESTEIQSVYNDGPRGPTGPGQIGKGIFFETRSGKTVRAGMVSDGALLILGFLALTHIPIPPPLLLIEEPENGIYPKRLGEIIQLLQKLAKGDNNVRFPQIILTTHSPYVLSFFKPEEVTFLSRPPGDPDGPVRARPLSQAPNIHERLADGDFYLGELWYNLSEEDLFGAA
ncbi:MAG: AAA family ATPase [Thermoguttaceae bacterium]